MALSKINGQDGTAAVSIAAAVYTCILSEWEFDSNVDQIDSTTFCTEADGDFEAGRTTSRFSLAGYLTKGTAVAGPILPPPQNVAIVLTASTGCTLTFTGNFSRSIVRRTAAAAAVIAAEGVVKGAVVKAWVVS